MDFVIIDLYVFSMLHRADSDLLTDSVFHRHIIITGKQWQRHGVKIDCNQEASLVRCVRSLIDSKKVALMVIF